MFRHYITKYGKKLRCGYTTGTCAAGAAGAAVEMLLTGRITKDVSVKTPGGIGLQLDILDAGITDNCARCAIRKDSGDDPDITNGMLIYATARRTERGMTIDGGEGIGRVTQPGLDQPTGAAAINTVPRKMILQQIREVCERYDYKKGIEVIISIPGGASIARKTFNPRLGIEGGLSILGTTGIVEPMSTTALLDTVKTEMRVLSASGAKAVPLCPGNYGETFAQDVLGLTMAEHINIGNFVCDAVQSAIAEGMREILLVGHIGKLVKLGIGMTNTHSRNGDGRMETLIASALACGGDLDLLRGLQNCTTTDAAIELLESADMLSPVMSHLGERIQDTLVRWVSEEAIIGFICFTFAGAKPGVLMKSANAEDLAARWRK